MENPIPEADDSNWMLNEDDNQDQENPEENDIKGDEG